jgi:hypothetical protein
MNRFRGGTNGSFRRPWSPAPPGDRLFRAALALALDFWSWRSLAAAGVETEDAVRLMVRLVVAAAEEG